MENIKLYDQELAVKVASWQGRIVNIYPEYEECQMIAEEKGLSLLQVIQDAQRAAQDQILNVEDHKH